VCVRAHAREFIIPYVCVMTPTRFCMCVCLLVRVSYVWVLVCSIIVIETEKVGRVIEHSASLELLFWCVAVLEL
jgi:hypothetical protein